MIGLAIYSCHCLYKAALPPVKACLTRVKERLSHVNVNVNAEGWVTTLVGYQIGTVTDRKLMCKMQDIDDNVKNILSSGTLPVGNLHSHVPWSTFVGAIIGTSFGYYLMPRSFGAGRRLTFVAGTAVGVLGTVGCFSAPMDGAILSEAKGKVIAFVRQMKDTEDEH